MIVQIYSLETAEEAAACAEAGADQIGVLVSRKLDGRYPCEVLPEQALEIFDRNAPAVPIRIRFFR